jgi:anaerobic selenocysteine-containing dehydrogenase/ferredoxin-NADP reductase
MLESDTREIETRTPGFCALCKSRCGSILVTRGGRFVAQEPNPDHPTGQALCIKGRAAPEIVYSSERQLYPLERTRPKGDPDPGWRRITWDKALDRIASELDRIRSESGPEAVVFGLTTPSGTPISDDIRWIERFTNAFGSPNIAYGTEICNWHKDYAHAYTFGRSIASPDFQKSGCVVLWGHNPSATWLDHATATGSARASGARLIVVDPRRVGFASRADQWLRVRPGADGALALGIAGEMIRNGWFDIDFMRDWTNGPLLVRADTNRFLRAGDLATLPAGADHSDLVAWSAQRAEPVYYSLSSKSYREGVRPDLESFVEFSSLDGGVLRCHSSFSLYRDLCDQYPPESVEAIAWVPGTQVTQTAKLLSESGSVSYYIWSGVGQHTNATQTDRAISLLMSLTGSFDSPGGNVEFVKPPARDVTGGEFLSASQRAKCIDLERSKLGPGRHGWIGSDVMYKAILDGKPYPIRGLFGFGRNFIVNHANGDRGALALSKLDFYVHSDVVMTPTATYADIFLPINTPWERDALRVGFEGSQAAESLVQLRQAAIPSVGESRSDAFVVFELAKRLGFGDLFWNGDVTRGLEAVLEPLEITLADLRAKPGGISFDGEPHYMRYRKSGFKTHTGKLEVFSEVFRDEGQDPLPRFLEPALSPYRGGGSAFPLVLTSAKVVQYCHGQHRHIASLRRRSPDPEVSLHPDAAGDRGIGEGDWVEILTKNGRARMRAKFDAGLDKRVVSAQYGWWQGNEELGLPAFDALLDKGANYNRLVSDTSADPISGSTGLRSSVCEIIPVDGSRKRAWNGWRPFFLLPNGRESPDIVSFALRPVDGAVLPSFRGGQHITLRVKGSDDTLVVRCYTISRPTNGSYYRISVKLARGADESSGWMSGLLHSRGAEPLLVDLQAPKGTFQLPTTANIAPLVMVAAGIGITPLLSMLYECAERSWQGSVRLFYGVRTGADQAFRSEIEALRTRLPGLDVTTFFSIGEVTHAAQRSGRISVDDVLMACSPLSHLYLCGPPGLIKALTGGLENAGITADRIHLEAFGPSARADIQVDRGPQPVMLVRSRTTLTWDSDKGSLLELLEDAGIKISSGCRVGQCESCLCRLSEGTVAHPEGTADVGAGHCLPCVAIPLSPIEIDL